MNIVKGGGGGILLRSTASTSYYLRINQNGTYALLLCGGAGTSCNKTLTGGISAYSSYIIRGQNKWNVLAIVAKGGQIYLYVNNTQIDFVNDSSSAHGQIGVVAEAGSEVVFRNARVWK